MSVNEHGVITKTVQNYTYTRGSSLHGLAFHPSGTYMYSADMHSRKLWTHAIDRATGKLTYVANETSHGEPRHVNVHPNGKFAYAVLEDANEVLVYAIDNSTGAAKYTKKSYSIIPASKICNLQRG
jgi:carboxy-cis,cis-muconate cyclase